MATLRLLLCLGVAVCRHTPSTAVRHYVAAQVPTFRVKKLSGKLVSEQRRDKVGYYEFSKRLSRLALAKLDRDYIDKFISDGTVFWYMDALTQGRKMLTQGAGGALIDFWPRPTERAFMNQTVQAVSTRLYEVSKELHGYFLTMTAKHSNLSQVKGAHVLGDADAFARPDVVVILGCANRDETDMRVAKAVEYAAAAESSPVFLTSGRGFWKRVAEEATDGREFQRGQRVDPKLHYPDMLDTKLWTMGVPSEAEYMTQKLLAAGVTVEILEDNDALDTVGNALFDYLTLLKAQKTYKSIAVVTSDYHTLRAYTFYRMVFPEDMKLAVVASRSDKFLQTPVDKLANLVESESVPYRTPHQSSGTTAAHKWLDEVKFITEDQGKVTLSLRDMFSEIDLMSGESLFLPAGDPASLLFQFFKTSDMHGHGLYNGGFNGGPVDFNKMPPQELLKSYLETYASVL